MVCTSRWGCIHSTVCIVFVKNIDVDKGESNPLNCIGGDQHKTGHVEEEDEYQVDQAISRGLPRDFWIINKLIN